MSGGRRDRPIPAISIVMPAFNECESLPAAVDGAIAAAASLGLQAEVIVVDDGSIDTSGQVLRALSKAHEQVEAVTHPVNRGYGAALRSGFGASRSELVFYTDADNQFDLAELERILPLIESSDLVVGYRVGRSDPRLRLVAAWVYNRIADILFDTGVRDVDCSFKLIRRDALDRIDLESDDFFIDTELIAKARRLGLRIREEPVRHFPRAAGETTVRPSHVLMTLRDIAVMWRPIRRLGR